MKTVHVITPGPVHINDEPFDPFDLTLDRVPSYKEGIDERGKHYSFLTNSRSDRRTLYEEAVRTWDGPEEFGIADYATDRSGREITGYFAFYARSIDPEMGLSMFWAHFRALDFELCLQRIEPVLGLNNE